MMKAVFFDIDDTLFHFSQPSQKAMEKVANYVLGQLWIEEDVWKDALKQAQDKIGKRLGYDSPAFHNRQIRFQNALEILRQPIYPYATEMYKIYWNTVFEDMEPEPGIEQLLKLLKKKKIYLGIGSDMTSYIQNKKLEKLKLASYFDSIITSEEAGRDKPAPEIFTLCIEKCGYKPEECLFIGDNWEKDVAGARGVGMNAIGYGKYSTVPDGEEAWSIQSYETCVQGQEIVFREIII